MPVAHYWLSKDTNCSITAWVSSIDTGASDDLKSCCVMCDITCFVRLMLLYLPLYALIFTSAKLLVMA